MRTIMPHIIALDQGTTSSRSIVFDLSGQLVTLAQREFTQIYPQPGWVEHDPREILASQTETAIEALKKADLSAAQVSALGVTNQRETTVIWEKATGMPIYNAIVWQDRRTSEFCTRVRQEHGAMIREKTGLEVDAYFSASKIAWLLDNVTGARTRAERGELAFGTIDTWLVWHLTQGNLHITDVSNASRTMLFDIHTLAWDDELLGIFNVPRELLPEVRGSSEIYGEVQMPNELKGLAIAGIAGDQQAALFGQACFERGAVKNTYGTGCFMLQNTGETANDSRNNLLTTVGWRIGGRTEYAIEGSVFIGGAVVQWLRDALGIIKTSSEVEELARSVSDNGGVYFVPAFAGLGAPHWDQNARGLLIGLTRGTGKAHIARAALESIAYQTADLLDAMNADSHSSVSELKVDGGATANEMLMQFQADLLQIPIVRSAVAETTALGAAYLAGLAVGVWNSRAELAEHWRADRRYEPKMAPERAAELRSRWNEAVGRSKNWAV
jgi:glycerol kinase